MNTVTKTATHEGKMKLTAAKLIHYLETGHAKGKVVIKVSNDNQA